MRMMRDMSNKKTETTGQSKREKEFYEAIKKKNSERERLPRGQYVKKSIKFLNNQFSEVYYKFVIQVYFFMIC